MDEESIEEQDAESWVEDALHEGKYHAPTSIREKNIWICFRIEPDGDGGTGKVPKQPRGDAIITCDGTDPGEFGVTYDEALRAVGESRDNFSEDGHTGVGLCLDGDERLVGVDIDYGYDHQTGDAKTFALDVVERLDTYTEVSPSGDGLHALGFSDDGLNDDFDDIDNELGLELYEEKRFFTFTSRSIREMPLELRDVTDELVEIQRDYMDEKYSSEESESTSLSSHARTRELATEDAEIIELAIERDDGFEPLWRGNITDRGSDAQERADFKLCCKLDYWTRSDKNQIDSLFRKSGLMRPKWDEPRGSSTYGEVTIENAMKSNSW